MNHQLFLSHLDNVWVIWWNEQFKTVQARDKQLILLRTLLFMTYDPFSLLFCICPFERWQNLPYLPPGQIQNNNENLDVYNVWSFLIIFLYLSRREMWQVLPLLLIITFPSTDHQVRRQNLNLLSRFIMTHQFLLFFSVENKMCL